MKEAPLVLRLATLVHRASLLLHPRAFRREFGDELVETFREHAADVMRTNGAWALGGLLARALLDTLVARVAHRRTLKVVGARGSGAREWERGRGGEEMMKTFVRDLAVGLRGLIKRPLFTSIAVGTLALGIGANAAIFSVVNGVLIRPLPFPDAGQLVRLYHVNERTGNARGAFSLPDREDWAERTTALSSVAVYSTLPSGLLLTGGDEAIEVRTAYVSAGFFETLGRDAYLGRVLRDAEERGDNRVVVLSHGFWERRYGADESVVGSTIQLDDTGFLVAGVMPPDFVFPSADIEAWVFLTIIPPSSTPLHIREVRFLEAIGRVEADLTLDQAADEANAVASSLAVDLPDDNAELTSAALVPLRESITSGVEATLMVLLGTVGLVLLIACANVANLLLSRGVERRGELAIRQALGADRGRLVRQLLTESLLLSVAGGAIGVALATFGTDALVGRSQDLLPRAGEIGLDGTVLGFALVLTLLTAFVFGLLPALKLTRRPGTDPLPGPSRLRGTQTGASRTWGALVATQVGLAIVVVIASGLLLRSVWELQSVDIGLESDRLVALSLTINDARYPERPAYLAMYEQLMERLEATPGIEAAGSIRYLPLRRDGESTRFSIPSKPDASDDQPPDAMVLQVSPGFFEAAGVPLMAGRDFNAQDGTDSPPVVIINDALRRRYFAGEAPVGESLDPNDSPAEIVGVVGDIRQRGLAEEARPTLYVPQAQNPRRGMAFVLRTEGDPVDMLTAVRSAVLAVDPDQPIEHLAVMDDVVFSSSAQPRFFSLLLASFGLLALLLATFGIYGVVSHSVSRRTTEIGIRVALGAPAAGVVAMVIRGGMLPVLVGAAGGLVGSVFAMRLLRSLLFGVSTVDPLTFAAVPVLLTSVAFLACWLPAKRAVRIDPTEALRSE